MTQIAIPATIKPVEHKDVLSPLGGIRNNMLYFFYKPEEKRFCGAFYLHEDYDYEELWLQVRDGMIYTIGYGQDDYTFLLQLRNATPDDLKDGRFLRIGFCYYLRFESDVVEGPYYLNDNTDTQKMAEYLANNQLYVVGQEQTFTPFGLQHTA